MNNVCLIGNLVRDPELRYTPSGAAVTRFTIAVSRKMSKEKKQEAENKNQPTADFISCTAWNKTAELIANYFKKGSKIGIQGRIQTGSYEKDGHTVYTTDIVVDSIDFLDSQANSQQQAQGQTFGGSNDAQGFFPIDNENIPF